MASPVNAALCALLATGFWTLLGYALARHLFPRVLAVGAAAVVGWAVHSAVMLPIYIGVGFSSRIVIAAGALCALAAGISLLLRTLAGKGDLGPTIPAWTLVAAAVLALVPAVAILPKFSGDAVQFAAQVFDHSKVAIVDAIARLGLPPVNPVFGEAGAPEHLAYYYLWHFSAAELALALGVSGWEADIGLTWFTAFAALALMMGVAVWLAKRPAAAIWVVALATACSLWVTLNWIFHTDDFRPFLRQPIGMAGWLFQAAWVPQHLMASSCTVVAMLLLAFYARQQRLAFILPLALVVAAGFESSTFVGGVTFAFAVLAAAPILLVATEPARRVRCAVGLVVAALLVIALITPFLLDQLATVRARGAGNPIVVDHYRVFGELFPRWLRRLIDLPGYWLVILPIELPATYFAGIVALTAVLRSALPRQEKLVVATFACLAGAGLIVAWLLVSTVGENNDLGLRAIIPAEIVLIVSTAMVAASFPGNARRAVIAIALAGLALSLPDTVTMIQYNLVGEARPGGKIFAESPALWAAVRRHAAPDARVANNPMFLSDLTPWPVNISWALLANRNSCFAGSDLAAAFAPLPAQRREAIKAQFARAFDGRGTPDDVSDMARKYGCEIVVVVPQDKAWNGDPFAASPDYRLAEERDGRWRIYARQRKD